MQPLRPIYTSDDPCLREFFSKENYPRSEPGTRANSFRLHRGSRKPGFAIQQKSGPPGPLRRPEKNTFASRPEVPRSACFLRLSHLPENATLPFALLVELSFRYPLVFSIFVTDAAIPARLASPTLPLALRSAAHAQSAELGDLFAEANLYSRYCLLNVLLPTTAATETPSSAPPNYGSLRRILRARPHSCSPRQNERQSDQCCHSFLTAEEVWSPDTVPGELLAFYVNSLISSRQRFDFAQQLFQGSCKPVGSSATLI